MLFSHMVDVFERIESMSSRLEMTEALASLLKDLTPYEAQIVSYMALGSLDAVYKNVQFNIAKKGLIECIASLLQVSSKDVLDNVNQQGDVGLVIQSSWNGACTGLSIEDIYKQLHDIAAISGSGSTELKQNKIVDLLKRVDSMSAKYIVRIMMKTLRLGFSDMTMLDAFSWMYIGNKSIRKILEEAYNNCADLGLVVYNLKDQGIDAIQNMKCQVGIPIRPAAADRLKNAEEVIEKLGACAAQPKLDGFRLQIHLDKTGDTPVVKFYSRNLVDMSEMFPDVVEEIVKLPVDNLICEGEAIGYDPSTDIFLPFQETVKRKRKHGIDEMSQDIPLRVYLFDLLFLNDTSVLFDSHEERREKLKQVVDDQASSNVFLIEEIFVDNAKDLNDYFLQSIGAGLEGLVVKRPDAVYQPGKRNSNWIKLKRQTGQKLGDTIDAVVLGYYFGQGKRAQFGIGAFLVGIFNPDEDRYESVAKVGTGLTDIEWVGLKAKCDKIAVDHQLQNVWVNKDLHPDVWVYPELVVVIRADDITQSPAHTAGITTGVGYALRFPRFMHYRTDKSGTDTTNSQEIKTLYDAQFS